MPKNTTILVKLYDRQGRLLGRRILAYSVEYPLTRLKAEFTGDVFAIVKADNQIQSMVFHIRQEPVITISRMASVSLIGSVLEAIASHAQEY